MVSQTKTKAGDGFSAGLPPDDTDRHGSSQGSNTSSQSSTSELPSTNELPSTSKHTKKNDEIKESPYAPLLDEDGRPMNSSAAENIDLVRSVEETMDWGRGKNTSDNSSSSLPNENKRENKNVPGGTSDQGVIYNTNNAGHYVTAVVNPVFAILQEPADTGVGYATAVAAAAEQTFPTSKIGLEASVQGSPVANRLPQNQKQITNMSIHVQLVAHTAHNKAVQIITGLVVSQFPAGPGGIVEAFVGGIATELVTFGASAAVVGTTQIVGAGVNATVGIVGKTIKTVKRRPTTPISSFLSEKAEFPITSVEEAATPSAVAIAEDILESITLPTITIAEGNPGSISLPGFSSRQLTY